MIETRLDKNFKIKGFFDEETSTISYVVYDIYSKKCAVIDSVLDFDFSSGTIDYHNADKIISYVKKENLNVEFEGDSHVTVIYDDEEVEFSLNRDGETILDAAMDNDLDVPFSCKGAVCCTCKAKVTEGKVTMDANYALSDQEVEDGYVLACQSHPASAKVTLDFD